MKKMNIGKAHQRIIREQKESKQKNKDPLFGDWWEANHRKTDIKSAEIKEITYQEAKPIILGYEWLGTMGTTQYHYGIFFNGECAGVVCYGYLQAINGYKNYVGQKYFKSGIQLSRGACVWWAHEHTASKLISGSLDIMKTKGFKWAIAFSDPLAGEIGTVYQATNWHYLGYDDAKTVHWHIYRKCDDALFMNYRDFCKRYKHRNLKKYLQQNPDLYTKPDHPKARYIYFLGTHKENKEMLEKIQPFIRGYKKRAGQVSREIHSNQ